MTKISKCYMLRGFCFADFINAFRKLYKSYRYIVTFIGKSKIDTGGVSREFYSSLYAFECINEGIPNRGDAGCTR